ncbi:MAG: hypothetical protein ACOC4M_09675 [Promethearchaeia archaeon]
MPDVHIKAPNSDQIFEKWKNQALSKQKKNLEKHFGTKGSVFSLNNVSAAETVKETLKEAAIYFAIKKVIEPVKDKDEVTVVADKLHKEDFYMFKDKVNKENWGGDKKVPMFNTIKPIACKKCGGKGYLEYKCKECGGSGKIEEKWKIYVGEEENKEKTKFSYPCGECYGMGKLREKCDVCEGHKNLYTYQILPVPFKTVITGIPVLHSSAKTKYEREIKKDLHKLIRDVEGIKFRGLKNLKKKAEPSLGYWNKNIKKTIKNAAKDYKKYGKADEYKMDSPIYLFPMIQLICETKRGKDFEIYSIGSQNKFIVYSDF